MYRVGFPLWKIAARFGVSLLIKVDVVHDKEAGVFVATSQDLRGLVAEATTIEALFSEVYNCVDMLMEEELKRPPKTRPAAAWTGELIPA